LHPDQITAEMRGFDGKYPSFAKIRDDKHAKVAQLVERNLAKVKVAGSRPVFRSRPAKGGHETLSPERVFKCYQLTMSMSSRGWSR
jgi:hypothetical protein